MNQKKHLVIFVSLISMIAGITLFQYSGIGLNKPDIKSAQPGQAGTEVPTSLNNVFLTDLQGVSHTLNNWKQPVLVINFWAPWCVPCRREVPDLIALQREFGDRIQIFGLALDSAENIKSFADEHQMNYPSYLAMQDIAMYNTVFENKSGTLPFTAIIDQNRQIDFTHNGIISLQTLRQQVTKLL